MKNKTGFIYNKKEEKGAITLYVLLACLFFCVYIIRSIYISNINRLQSQEEEISQIKENYAREIENIEEVYKNIVGMIKVTLKQEPENGTWTNKVILTGKGEVLEDEEVKIIGYAFSKDSTDPSRLKWTDVDNEISITETMEVKENGKYYFWVKDNEGNIQKSNEVEVNNIDDVKPIAGSLIAKEENAEGEEYTYNTWTDKDVYIEKVDGSDPEPGSGHKKTTYTILKNGIKVEEGVEEPRTLTETGIYTIKVITEDNAGNIAESEEYIVKIDKIVPMLGLKHNNAEGEKYISGTWTKDDLYGEIEIDTSSTGKEVEKYQYSYNGIIWTDIIEGQTQTSIDYTTKFPMTEEKPEWIKGPINNGTYYFEIQEDGTLKPNNSGINSKTANSYFEIDLSQYPEATLELTINATISSESNRDYGYATITNSTTAPAYSTSTGRIMRVSGATKTADHKTTLTGGQKYYLHIGYRKDSANAVNQDTFIINSIRLKSDALINTINYYDYEKTDNKITFKLKEDIDREIYLRAVYTEEDGTSRTGDKTAIKIDKTAPIMESANSIVLSQTEAKAEITVKEEASGVKGYYISEEEIEAIEISNWTEQTLKEFTIESLKTDTTYYLWVIDNARNISEKQEIVVGKANYLIDDSIYTETL